MTYLLDVSTLLACLWRTHVFHDRVQRWIPEKELAICPITELGFLRVSVSAYGADLDQAREMLRAFLAKHHPAFVPCDLRALDGAKAPSGAKTTDYYLADLADRHGMQWATLDETVRHQAAWLLPYS
jgi:predicted nucleic acid-binding protein